MGKLDLQNSDRRNFLRTVPVAAAAALAFSDASMFSSIAEAQAPRGRGQRPSFDGPYTYYSKEQLDGFIAAEGANGGKTLFMKDQQSTLLSLQRPRLKPRNMSGMNTATTFSISLMALRCSKWAVRRPGRTSFVPEWLAPTSAGAAKVTLNKGDM